MPDLRARETNLRNQIQALDNQLADREAYLKLASDLEGFLTQLHTKAETSTVQERQRVLRLLVKDILIGPEKITIRHRIPIRDRASNDTQHTDTDTEGEHCQVRWGRDIPVAGERLPALRLRPVGRMVETPPRARRCDHRALGGRLHRGLRAARRCAAVPHRPSRAVGEVRAGATPRQDAADRVRRFAAQNRQARGLGKPETFDFLGFTHICATMRDGRFWVRRITISKRMRAKLREVKDELKLRRHQPIPDQGQWLASVVRGHRAYYAVPGNRAAVATFRTQVTRLWHEALERRSQRTRINWARMDRLATRWLAPPV